MHMIAACACMAGMNVRGARAYTVQLTVYTYHARYVQMSMRHWAQTGSIWLKWSCDMNYPIKNLVFA